MCKPCTDPSDRSKAVLASDIFLHRPDLRKVLKCDDQSGRFICLGNKLRNVIADPHRKTIGRNQVGLEARRLFVLFLFAKRMVDRFLNIAEKRMDRAPDHFAGSETRDLRRGSVECEDLSIEVCRDQPGADRLDDTLVKKTQIRKAFSGFFQLLPGKAALGEPCRKEPYNEKGHNVEADD